MESEYTNLAFVPLDIEIPEFNFDELEDWNLNYSIANITDELDLPAYSKSRAAFHLAVAKGKGDFSDLYNIQQLHEKSFANRYISGSEWQNNFDQTFPTIAQFINNLPMEVNHFELLINKMSIFSHIDEWEIDGIVDPLWSPFIIRTQKQIDNTIDGNVPVSLIKVWLYEKEEDKKKSFYMVKDYLEDPVYCWGPGKYFVGALSKAKYPHGADKTQGRKIVFNIHGVLDKEKHQEIVKKSLNKYGEYACWF